MYLPALDQIVLDPAAQKFVDEVEAQGGPPIYTLTVEKARGVLEQVQASPGFLPGVEEEPLDLPGGPGGMVLRPRGAVQGKLPAIVYFHGGGWVLGSDATHSHLLRTLCVTSGCAVVYVNYSRAPEARYPIALEECFSVLQHLTLGGGKHRIDSARLAVAGDSAGGNLATVTALLAHVRGLQMPRAQVLFYPVTSAGMDSASYEQFSEGPWLTRKAMQWFWDLYLAADGPRKSFEVSPLFALDSDLEALPETMLITAEADVLRDEGESYAKRLLAAGVPVTAMRYPGMIHDFVMLNALADAPAAKHAIQSAADFLRKALTR